MRRHLLITAAAASLAAGTMFAAAQGQKQGPAGSAEPGAQGQMPGGQTPGGQDRGKAQSKPPMTQGQGGGQAQGQPGQDRGKTQSKETTKQREGEGQRGTQTQREGREGQQQKGAEGKRDGQQQKGAEGKRDGQQQKGAEGKRDGTTTKLSQEQRTKIRTTVINRGPRVSNVNFSINVGTVVPRSVEVVAVPPVLIEYYPQWRGYRYFIAGERIVIIDDNFRIVAVLVV